MKSILEQTLQTRKIYYNFLTKTSKEDLLKIPTGYNNNIWWNIAHVVATQQALMYRLSGLSVKVSLEFMDKFKKGTTPSGDATDEEIDEIKTLLFSSAETAIVDYENEMFSNFKEYTTSANVTLKDINDAISFNHFHEGLHIGSILALKRAVKLED